jgi:hypothetical protein
MFDQCLCFILCVFHSWIKKKHCDFLLLRICQLELLFSTLNPLIAESLGCCTILKEFKCHIISENQLSTPVDQESGKLAHILPNDAVHM